jgi:hypothetical protein
MRSHTLIETNGIIHHHRRPIVAEKASPNEKPITTVGTPRKPGEGTPQNPPPKQEPKK